MTKIQHYYAAINADPDRSLDRSSIESQLADRQQAIKDKKAGFGLPLSC